MREAGDMQQQQATGGVTQSIAVAVASALMLFAVVGLIASRTSVPHAVIASESTNLSAAGGDASVRQASMRAEALPTDPNQPLALSITVPANRAVVVDTGVRMPSVDGSVSSSVLIPPLAPGHHVLSLGMHQLVVTAVSE